MDSLGKTREDIDSLCSRNGCKFGVTARRLTVAHLMGSANVACYGGSGNNFGTGKVALGVARSHAAFEIAIGGGDSNFAGLEQSNSQTNAWATSRG